MKRLLLITATLLAWCAAAMAQNKLEVTEITGESFDVVGSLNDAADSRPVIQFIVSKSMPLRFYSYTDPAPNFETPNDDAFITPQGDEIVYTWRVKVLPENKADKRVIEIDAFNHDRYKLNVRPLQPRDRVVYRVLDPMDPIVNTCYRQNRNKALEEVRRCNYRQAQNMFIQADLCPDIKPEEHTENQQNLDLVANCIEFRQRADQAYESGDYAVAIEYYNKVVSLNMNDEYARSQRDKVKYDQGYRAEMQFAEAKAIWDQGKKMHKDAVVKFREISKSSGSGSTYGMLANDYVIKWTQESIASVHKPHVLTYEWRKDVPIGLHIGKYNLHRAGGFFQIDLNTKIFDLIRGDGKLDENDDIKKTVHPEFNIAFGWTIHLFGDKSPVWIHVGPGFTGKFYYGTYKEKNYPMADSHDLEVITKRSGETEEQFKERLEDAPKKVNFAPAISPVVGITIKWRFLAARVTYQYRFTFKSQLKNFMGPSRVSFGVGVAF